MFFKLPNNDISKITIKYWREISVVVLLPCVLATLLALMEARSTLTYFHLWLGRDSIGTDSWKPMLMAASFLESGSGNLYEVLFFERQIKFQYPPTSLVIFHVARMMGISLSAENLNLLSWFCLLGTALIGAMLGQHYLKKIDNIKALDKILVGIVCLAASFLFYPVLKAYQLGQVQVWLNFLFACSCLAWLHDRKLLAGVLIGAMCLFKPQFSMFLIWGLLRREFAFIAGWTLVVAIGLAASISWFGLANHLDYLNVLRSLGKTGESFYANQSINGVLNRLFETGPALKFRANAFPVEHVVVRWGTTLSSIAIMLSVLFFGRQGKQTLMQFQLAALGFTLASPIAWEHHYGVLPVMYITFYFWLRSESARLLPVSRLAVLLALSYCLTSNFVLAMFFDKTPGKIAFSSLLIGAFLLFGLLWTATRSVSREGSRFFSSSQEYKRV